MGSSTEAGHARSAVFVDLESLAADGRNTIDIDLASIVGTIEGQSEPLIKNAYADWSRFSGLREKFLEAGFVEVQASYLHHSKSGVDQQLTVDARTPYVEPTRSPLTPRDCVSPMQNTRTGSVLSV